MLKSSGSLNANSKIKLMKKIKIFSIVAFTLSITGCLKDDPNVDLSNVKPTAEISSGSLVSDNSPISGLSYFKSATLPSFSKDTSCNCYLPDTVTCNVNITGEFPPAKDVAVTLGIDDAKRVMYNSLATSTVQYEAAPDSIYTLLTKSVLVKAGSRLAKVSIVFYPDKIDPTTSYLFPVSIIDASGTLISGNLGTVYFHNLGNPLAGAYSVIGTRYNYTGSVPWSGPPAAVPAGYTATTDLTTTKSASPDNTTTMEVPLANISPDYTYKITYNAATQSISVTYSDAVLAYSNIETYVVSFTPPSNTQKASFHIITHYNNAAGGAGNDRIMDETFVHQ